MAHDPRRQTPPVTDPKLAAAKQALAKLDPATRRVLVLECCSDEVVALVQERARDLAREELIKMLEQYHRAKQDEYVRLSREATLAEEAAAKVCRARDEAEAGAKTYAALRRSLAPPLPGS